MSAKIDRFMAAWSCCAGLWNLLFVKEWWGPVIACFMFGLGGLCWQDAEEATRNS